MFLQKKLFVLFCLFSWIPFFGNNVVHASELEDIFNKAIQNISQGQYEQAIPKLQTLFDDYWLEMSPKGQHLSTTLMLFSLYASAQEEMVWKYGQKLYQTLPGCFVSFQEISNIEDEFTPIRNSLKLLAIRKGKGKGILYLHNTSKHTILLTTTGSSFDVTYGYRTQTMSVGKQSVLGVSPALRSPNGTIELPLGKGIILASKPASQGGGLFGGMVPDFIAVLAADVASHHSIHDVIPVGTYEQTLYELHLVCPEVMFEGKKYKDVSLIKNIQPKKEEKVVSEEDNAEVLENKPEKEKELKPVTLDSILEECIQIVERRDQKLGWNALHALRELGEHAKSTTPILLKALKEDFEPLHVLNALAKIEGTAIAEEVVPLVIQMYQKESESYQRYILIGILGKIAKPTKKVFDFLLEAYSKEDDLTQFEIIKAFGNFGSKGSFAVPIFIKGLQDRNETMRGEIIEILVKIAPKDKQVLSVLKEALQSPSPYMKWIAFQILKQQKITLDKNSPSKEGFKKTK